MDLFNTIDEYEAKMNEQIKDKLSLFTKIMLETDMYEKFILNQDKNEEVNPEPNTKEIIEEIKNEKKIMSLIYQNCKNYGKINKDNQKNPKKTQKNKNKNIKNKNIFDSKAYSSNLTVSQYINYFDQKTINQTNKICQFYSKDTETELISKIVIQNFTNQIKKKLFIACHDDLLSPGKPKFFSYKCDKESSVDKQETEEQSETELEKRLHIINQSIERLYPKPKPKDDYLSDEFFIEKINRCRKEGNLSTLLDIDKLISELKINRINNYEGDIKENVKLTDDIITNYYNNKYLMQELMGKQNKKNILYNKGKDEFHRGDINLTEKMLLNTKSKLYVRVNRNRDDLLLIGKQIKN